MANAGTVQSKLFDMLITIKERNVIYDLANWEIPLDMGHYITDFNLSKYKLAELEKLVP